MADARALAVAVAEVANSDTAKIAGRPVSQPHIQGNDNPFGSRRWNFYLIFCLFWTIIFVIFTYQYNYFNIHKQITEQTRKQN